MTVYFLHHLLDGNPHQGRLDLPGNPTSSKKVLLYSGESLLVGGSVKPSSGHLRHATPSTVNMQHSSIWRRDSIRGCLQSMPECVPETAGRHPLTEGRDTT